MRSGSCDPGVERPGAGLGQSLVRLFSLLFFSLRVDFLLKTDSGYFVGVCVCVYPTDVTTTLSRARARE